MNMTWIKVVAVTALAVGGVAGGMYLSKNPALPGVRSTVPCAACAKSDGVQRFALTAFDVKDQIEAPQLAVDDGGHVVLAWASQSSEGERALFLSLAGEEGVFPQPRTIARTGIAKFVAQMKGKTITRESRMLPHVAIADGVLHAAWVEALPGLTNVRLMHAVSDDAGESFAPPIQVHQSEGARPTFTALTAMPDGTVACSWLDNRDKLQMPYAAIKPAGSPIFEPEVRVSAGEPGKGTCPCCPTAAALAADGTLYVAFRDIADGHRDISIHRKKPGQAGFEGPFPIAPPTWKFDGCPHDGASLAIVKDEIHVVWMDAHSGSPRCYYAKASLAEMKFAVSELHPIAEGSQGNAKLAVDSEGTLLAAWEESQSPAAGAHHHGGPEAGASRAIMLATKHACCPKFGPARALAARDGAFQTRPAIAVTSRGECVIAWNELDENGKSIAVIRLPEQAGHE
jgi:hypothetical protein